MCLTKFSSPIYVRSNVHSNPKQRLLFEKYHISWTLPNLQLAPFCYQQQHQLTRLYKVFNERNNEATLKVPRWILSNKKNTLSIEVYRIDTLPI